MRGQKSSIQTLITQSAFPKVQMEHRKAANPPSSFEERASRRRSDREAEDDSFLPLQYWDILKRRRYLFAVPAIIVVVLALLYAFSLPPIYRSEATLLIENQDLPRDIVGTTNSSYATQQIESIRARLLTAKSIQQLAEKFDIYKSEDREQPMSVNALVKKFRGDMEIGLVPAAVIESRGRSSDSAIGFTLAFKSVDPEIAQQVTEDLVSLFLAENKRQSTSPTSPLLPVEASRYPPATTRGDRPTRRGGRSPRRGSSR